MWIEVEAGVAAAVDHVVARGRRRPVMIDCTAWTSARTGWPWPSRPWPPGRPPPALLDRHPDADALFGFNDLVAIGALRALRARGVRVPEDCAVVGFDGLALGELVTPALTSVRLDTRRLGALAVGQVRHLLTGARPVEPAALSCELVVRGSS